MTDTICWTGLSSTNLCRYANEHFVQLRCGQHHLCLRARSSEDVDKTGELVSSLGAKIVRGPEDGKCAPECYYILFEDPNGKRIEVNYVPGAGLLSKNAKLNIRQDYP